MNILKSLFLITALNFSYAANAQEWVPHQSPQKINDLVDNGSELIMATDYGLVVMNKTTLEKTTFTNRNSKLANNHISSITGAPNGDIYLSTDQTIGKFDGSDVLTSSSDLEMVYDTFNEQGLQTIGLRFDDIGIEPIAIDINTVKSFWIKPIAVHQIM